MPTPVLPDLLAVTRAALVAQTAVTSAVGSRVYARIPPAPTWPLLVLTVVDSGERSQDAGAGRVQVDVWGAGSDDTAAQAAYTIARMLVSVIRDLRGSYSGGKIANTGLALGPLPQPDEETGRVRWILDVFVETTP